MTKVIGLDTSSSSTGWAMFVDGEYKESGCLNFKGIKDSKTRMDQMIEKIYELLKNEQPDIVYFETPVVARNQQAQRTLSYICGAVIGLCIDKGIYWEQYRPTEWRKWAAEEGEKLPRKRDDLKQWSKNKVKTLLGLDVNDDEADSILLVYSAINKYCGRKD